jgi:transcriptional regulator with XRE-family HTH domain
MPNTHMLAILPGRAEARSVITGRQIRAARALLGWSPMDLAARAKLSYATIQRAEAAEGNVPNTKGGNLHAIEQALRAAGIVFLDGGEVSSSGGPGVRLAR